MYHCTSYVHHRVSLQTDYGFGILIFFVTSLINIKFNVSQKDVSLANVGYPALVASKVFNIIWLLSLLTLST